MKIRTTRVLSKSDETLSLTEIDDVFECFSLEDGYRKNKVAGETRIPAGTYKIKIRDVGGFHGRYLNRFDFHKGMLEIADVPGFEYILIHIGNDYRDTAGCLLVGRNYKRKSDGSLYLLSSKVAYERLYKKVIGAAIDGNLTITIEDLDR